jgi:hypothetical protein
MTNNNRFGAAIEKRFAQVQAFAGQWQPQPYQDYVLNNAVFRPLTQWQPHVVAEYLAFLQDHGTFDFGMHPQSGLLETSDTLQAHMHRQWITDSCMGGWWQRSVQPTMWQRNMATQAGVMQHPSVKQAVQAAQQNPDWYRKGPVENGIFHLYFPDSLVWDAQGTLIPEHVRTDATWHNCKRLESQAQLLYYLATTSLASPLLTTTASHPWGFEIAFWDSPSASHVIDTMIDLTRYLVAVTTDPATGKPNFVTPSAGAWEEYPFPQGMTSDAAWIVLALETVANLTQVAGAYGPLVRLPQALAGIAFDAWIAAGRDYIHQRITVPLQSGQAPVQTPDRPDDMCLLLLAGSPYVFDLNDPIADVKIRLGLVRHSKQALQGPYGIRRFNHYHIEGLDLHDNYLNYAAQFPRAFYAHWLGITLTPDEAYPIAGEDASAPATLIDRQLTSRWVYSAQWGLGQSAALQAMARARQTLLALDPQAGAMQPSQNPTESPPAPLEQCLFKQVTTELLDSLNRCLAAIPGPLHDQSPLILRADGSPCPPYAAMEAWQVVPDEKGQAVWLPGANTLPWHAAQLYDGLCQCTLPI